jgi:hypothetical protein
MKSVPNDLATALLAAVRAQRFADTADALRGGGPVGVHPSIDLAVAAFDSKGSPRFANVLFSREHADGIAAQIDADAGRVRNLRYLRDLQDAQRNSAAWLPGADWSRLPFKPLAGDGAHRFVAPYPASLLKLMVAVGVGLAVDAGRCAWPADVIEPMLVVSSNEATDEMVKLLHQVGGIESLHAAFERFGLATLRLENTTPQGGWRNADGSGVGHIHMTAWDTVRLLWLLDAEAPPPPWARGEKPLLQPATRDLLRGVLERQQLNEILSSGSLTKLPNWVEGIPARARFAHKTGTTENFASDAGIVRDGATHYLVAFLSNLGDRYAPHPDAATTWRVPALGAAVHRIMQGLP